METLAQIEGPCEQFTVEGVKGAIDKTKNGMAIGPSKLASDMLKCSGEAGVRLVTDLCKAIVRDGVNPKDWRKSLMGRAGWELEEPMKGQVMLWNVDHIDV